MIEKEFDKMLEDLDSANDEFVNDYFNDMDDLVFEREEEPVNTEEPKEEIELAIDTKPVEEELDSEPVNTENKEPEYQNRFTSFSKSNINKLGSKKIKVYHKNKFEKKEEIKEEIKKPFSYNEILDRLDKEKKYDINNINDLMKLIDKCDTTDEFFNYVESETHDK